MTKNEARQRRKIRIQLFPAALPERETELVFPVSEHLQYVVLFVHVCLFCFL